MQATIQVRDAFDLSREFHQDLSVVAVAALALRPDEALISLLP